MKRMKFWEISLAFEKKAQRNLNIPLKLQVYGRRRADSGGSTIEEPCHSFLSLLSPNKYVLDIAAKFENRRAYVRRICYVNAIHQSLNHTSFGAEKHHESRKRVQ